VSLLKVENLSKNFGSLIAVDNVSMTVEAGELRPIVGEVLPLARGQDAFRGKSGHGIPGKTVLQVDNTCAESR